MVAIDEASRADEKLLLVCSLPDYKEEAKVRQAVTKAYVANKTEELKKASDLKRKADE